MCGRFSLAIETKELADYLYEEYSITDYAIDFVLPRYNIAPQQEVVAVISDGTKFRAGTLKWGLLPHFAQDEAIGSRMINARAETLSEKSAFKSLLSQKRCIILADGFYEWKKVGNERLPHRFILKNQKIFAFAGLWSHYLRSDGSKLFTCTIITTQANRIMEPIHERMPVILTKEAQKIWLNPQIKDPKLLTSILTPFSAMLMDQYPVSSLVNNARNEDPTCILPLSD